VVRLHDRVRTGLSVDSPRKLRQLQVGRDATYTPVTVATVPGSRIGDYDVLAKIGEGGMGEVYRARDTKLDRDVALKLLPETLAADPERIRRFEREAKTLASLNHTHIAQIYG